MADLFTPIARLANWKGLWGHFMDTFKLLTVRR